MQCGVSAIWANAKFLERMQQRKFNGLLVYPPPDPSSLKFAVDAEKAFQNPYVIPLGLLSVAACLPEHWNLRLVDCSIGNISDEDFNWADLVFTGGMILHREGVKEIIRRTHAAEKKVIVGGPDASSTPDFYHEADHVFVGEAEGAINQFLLDFEKGTALRRYGSLSYRADPSIIPTPRFDLLDPSKRQGLSIQITRGCPFLCDFCAIPQRSGRVPRVKSADQIVTELDSLFTLGFRGFVNIADDNLIGNMRAIKDVLRAVAKWQNKNKHPFSLYSMLTFNVADDDELLSLLYDAGFRLVFIGLESPSKEVLKSMQKLQNLRRVMEDSIRKIHSRGILVDVGIVMGNDAETDQTVHEIIRCVKTSCVDVTSYGILFAEPRTPLFDRLKKEKRILWDFYETAGTPQGSDLLQLGLNFIPVRDRRRILKDFCILLKTLFSARFYFRGTVQRLLATNQLNEARRLTIRETLRTLRRLPEQADLRASGFSNFLWFNIYGIRILRLQPELVSSYAARANPYLFHRKVSQHFIRMARSKIKDVSKYPSDHPQRLFVAHQSTPTQNFRRFALFPPSLKEVKLFQWWKENFTVSWYTLQTTRVLKNMFNGSLMRKESHP